MRFRLRTVLSYLTGNIPKELLVNRSDAVLQLAFRRTETMETGQG